MRGVDGGRAAAFFDVDGTIAATRSTTSLVWLRARQHGRLRHAAWLASLAWRAPLVVAADRVSRALADRLVYAQYRGLSQARLETDAEACCRDLLLPACFPQALAEIRRHQDAGRRVVLVTGGVEPVIGPLARALGVEMIAQRLEAAAGRYTGRHRSYALLDPAAAGADQGADKARAVARYAHRHGLDLAASYAYGDSRSDIAMLQAVGHPTAVNPSAALRRVAEGSGWRIQVWRRGRMGSR
jgi:HAD superfamily hydrolase (TIGR01490 family)